MSKEHIEKLVEERTRAWEAAKAILDSAEAEGRSLEGETEGSFQKANEDIDALDARIATMIEFEKRGAQAEELRKQVDGLVRPTEERQVPAESDLESRVRKFLSGEIREVNVMPESRVLVKGTTTAGGHTVPTTFYDRLTEHLIEVSGIRAAGATVITTTGGENIDFPKTTAHSSAALTSENAAISASDPTFGKTTIGAYKYGVTIQIARELLDDTAVDLLGYIARQAGRAVGNAVGVHWVTGSGSSQPWGAATRATAGVTGATSVAGAFTADNLIDLQYSVIAPYRSSPNCAWLMRDATLASVRKLKDTTNQYLWQPSLQVGAPDTLLGKPVYTDPNVAAAAIGAKSVLFGDVSAYVVREAGGIRFERSDEFAFTSDLVTFKCVYRADGDLVDTSGAIKSFQGGAS